MPISQHRTLGNTTHRYLVSFTLEIKEAPSFVTACYRQRSEYTGAISRIKYWLRDEKEYPGLYIIGNYAKTLEIVLHKSKILRYRPIITIFNIDI